MRYVPLTPLGNNGEDGTYTSDPLLRCITIDENDCLRGGIVDIMYGEGGLRDSLGTLLIDGGRTGVLSSSTSGNKLDKHRAKLS